MAFYIDYFNPIWSSAPWKLSLSLLLQWIVFAFNSEEVSSEITASPNTTVFVGQRFELSCYGNKLSKWIDWTQFRSENISNCPYGKENLSWCFNIVRSDVITNSQENRFNVSKNSNETHLSSTLSSEVTDLSHAGVYKCIDANWSKAFTYLTVIDPNPNCTIGDNSTTLNCSFAYFGWIPDSQRNPSASTRLINCTQEGKQVFCVVQTPGCRFGNAMLYLEALEVLDSANENENDETNSIRVDINVFEKRFYVNLRCIGSAEWRTTSSDVSSNIGGALSTDHPATYAIIIFTSTIFGVMALAILVLVLALKCGRTRKRQRNEFDIHRKVAASSNNEYEHHEMVEFVPHSSQYTSLQLISADTANLKLNDTTYAQLQNASSSNQEAVYETFEQDKDTSL